MKKDDPPKEMKRVDYLTGKLSLTTLSPLHIGSGEQLSSVGDFYTTTERLYFLDNNRLSEAIFNQDKRDEYIEKILEEGIGLNFYDTLEEWGIQPIDFEARSLPLNQFGLKSSQNDKLHLHIKTKGEAYIPGSSIKGLLRTAIIFKFLKEHPNLLSVIESEIQDIFGRTKSLYELEKYWEKREMDWTEKKKGEIEGLIPDKVFQAIRPYDSVGVADEKLIVEQVTRQSFISQSNNETKGVDWLVESIASDVLLPFELTIIPNFDYPDFQYLKSDSPKELFDCLNAHTLMLLQQERQLVTESSANPALKAALLKQLQQYESLIAVANGNYAVSRMGKGKTLFFQTILPLLNEKTKNAVLDLLKEKAVRKATPGASVDEPGGFPRSRVLTLKGHQMMGWVKFEANTWQKMLEIPALIAIVEPPQRPVPKKVEKKPTPVNHIKVEIKTGAQLKALVVGPRKTEFILNDQFLTDVQLVPLFKHQEITEGEIVNVVVHQMSKDGRIVQVKLNQ